MHAAPAGRAPAAFDLKSTSLPLVALVLKTADLDALAADLAQRFARTPQFFDGEPVVIDLGALAHDDAPLDVANLVALLRDFKMAPVAVRGGNEAQMQRAHAVGLTYAPDDARATAPRASSSESVSERAAVASPASVPPAAAPTTVVIDKPLRSGQRVYAPGGDIIVLALVSFDAEVIADGHVHVYAPLRGRAMAGARGNTGARIFSTCFEPQLVSIAGVYRTNEIDIPTDMRGQPTQVWLEGERIVMAPLAR